MLHFGVIVTSQSLFTRPRNAALFACFFPTMNGMAQIWTIRDDTPFMQIQIMTIFPSLNLIKTSRTLNFREGAGGINFGNMDWRHYHHSVQDGFIKFAVMFALLLAIGLYLDAINFSDVGAGEKPCFCFQGFRFCKGFCSRKLRAGPAKRGIVPIAEDFKENEKFETTYMDERFYEPLSEHSFKNTGVLISCLRKVYDDGLIAVDRVNLRLCKDEISVLLGHNGAGKTSMINCITGMVQATEGSVSIMGHDVGTDIEKVRQLTGVCPQHDVLFELLTPAEHLEVFYELKLGRPADKASEIAQLLEDIGLNDKKDALAFTLSGGNQRKLSVAIALCGGSKFVILDEPSSGLDIRARREMWTLLRKYKKDRVILLTTHYMDEADVLSQRIAILKQGKVGALGSSMFLKNKLDCGYILKIAKASESCPQAFNYIRSNIGNEVLQAMETKREMSFQIPSFYLPCFGDFFSALDREMGSIGVSAYSISQTTLSEVFSRINTAEVKPLDHENPQIKPIKGSDEETEKFSLMDNSDPSLIENFKAVARKKCLIFTRDRRSLAIDLILPSLLMVVGALCTQVYYFVESPSLLITTDLLPPQTILINNQTVF